MPLLFWYYLITTAVLAVAFAAVVLVQYVARRVREVRQVWTVPAQPSLGRVDAASVQTATVA